MVINGVKYAYNMIINGVDMRLYKWLMTINGYLYGYKWGYNSINGITTDLQLVQSGAKQ